MKNYSYEKAKLDIVLFDGDAWVYTTGSDTGVYKRTKLEEAIASEEESNQLLR